MDNRISWHGPDSLDLGGPAVLFEIFRRRKLEAQPCVSFLKGICQKFHNLQCYNLVAGAPLTGTRLEQSSRVSIWEKVDNRGVEV